MYTFSIIFGLLTKNGPRFHRWEGGPLCEIALLS